VDEQKELLELEAAVAKFETILHQSNAEVANMPPLPPRSPIGAALNFGAQKYTSIRTMKTASAPSQLPFAPRPLPNELFSSWVLRIAHANCVSPEELMLGFQCRHSDLPSLSSLDWASRSRS
jgi:TniQ